MWFKNLKIRSKLLVGFGTVIVLTLVLAFFAYYQLNETDKDYSNLMDNVTVRRESMVKVGRSYVDYRRIVATAIFRSGDTAALNSLKEAYNTEKLEMDKHFAEYLAAVNADKELSDTDKDDRRQRINAIRTALNDEYEPIVNAVFEFALQNDEESAITAVTDAATIATTINNEVNSLIETAQNIASAANIAATETANFAKTILLVVSLLVVLLATVTAMLIASIIRKGVIDVAEATKRISKGDFSVSVGSNGKDEISMLSNSLLELKTVVQGLTTDIDKMASNFTEGNLDGTSVNESSYEGEYKLIASGINRTVGDLIDNCLYAIQVVSDIGNGNFDIDIRQFPGQKAIMTTSFQTVKDNLVKFNEDIASVIAGAAAGNLDVNIDTGMYKGDWGKMAQGVNSLLISIVKPIREAIEVLNQLSDGKLDISVTGDYKGEFAAMKSALNNTLNTLASYINEISSVLGSMSNQNLTVSISREYVGEFVEIKKAINNIVNVFNQLIQEINSAASQVSAGSRQIAESSMSLAQGTAEQASSVEELNATIEDVANQTANNAKNADHASKLADEAKENAEKGNKEMGAMLTAMSEINESSASISKIIKVIDEIAFQTNLLALNAAVEAARAGEHGKGFAVVAEEVRNLAGRSQNAAKETSALIEGSIEKVSGGSKIADETAKSLEIIVSEINEISSIIGEVAQASIRQSDAIGQINLGINQISEVTQNNSATSEEQASATQELSSQADLFKAIVDKFKL